MFHPRTNISVTQLLIYLNRLYGGDKLTTLINPILEQQVSSVSSTTPLKNDFSLSLNRKSFRTETPSEYATSGYRQNIALISNTQQSSLNAEGQDRKTCDLATAIQHFHWSRTHRTAPSTTAILVTISLSRLQH